MVNVNVTEQHNRVIVQEDGTVRVVSVGIQGPAGVPGEPGPPGDLDVEELEQIVDDGVSAHSAETTDIHGIPDTAALETQNGAQSKATAAQNAAQDHADDAVSAHNAATSVHGVDTTQLATQDDLENIDALPDGTAGALLVHGAEDWAALPAGDDTHVLTLADGSPTWAAPEGGGGGTQVFVIEEVTESGTWDWESAGEPETVDVLVVAGGGGGGGNGPGGGGGAGGVIVEHNFPVSENVPITVGDGGAGGSGSSGSNGQNSLFGTLTAIGGGGGGAFNTIGEDGGSGGGGGGRNSTAGGSGVTGQGHDGGSAREGGSGGNNAAGGGGGYSGPGQDGTTELVGGNGGPGATFPEFLKFEMLAAGGGGGADGEGGVGPGLAGNGNASGVGQPAQLNSGSGGGGGGNNQNGGNGGSGIVLIRYPVDVYNAPIPKLIEEGDGGLDPAGAETITGDWHFDRENLRVGDLGFSIGLGASKSSTGVALGNQSQAHAGDVAIGRNAGFISVGGGTRNNVIIGHDSGRQNNASRMVAIGRTSGQSAISNDSTFIGRGAGRNNNRHNRLIIDTATSDNGNLVDPLIDGRFTSGTDSDSFEYAKGLKINGHLEATDQLILHSPDGTRWAITVDDSGNLSTAEATEGMTP